MGDGWYSDNESQVFGVVYRWMSEMGVAESPYDVTPEAVAKALASISEPSTDTTV